MHRILRPVTKAVGIGLAGAAAGYGLCELVLGADPDSQTRPRGLLALTRQLGWGVLAETRGREIVMGRKFRRYWAFVAPGVTLIRCMSMGIVKREAERRFQRASGSTTDTVVPPAGGTSI